MDRDREDGGRSADRYYSLAAEQLRNGVSPSEIEAMLVRYGLSQEMARLVIETSSEQGSSFEDLAKNNESRGFGNLYVDAWVVVGKSPILFILIPALISFPFNFFAEYIVLAQGGGLLSQMRTYNWVSGAFDILIGAWIVAVVFNGVRRIAEGQSVTVGRAILDGTRQYGRFLKTTWSVTWRVGLATMAFVIPGIVLTIRYMLAMPVTAFEGPGGSEAISASHRLVRGRSWRLFWYLLGFILVYLPWGLAIVWLLPVEESPLFNALAAAPFNVMIAFWSVWTALMYVDAKGTGDLAQPVRAEETRRVDGSLHRRAPRGRKRLTVTTLAGVVLMVLSIRNSPDVPLFDGERIIFGDDQQHEIYYDDDVEKTEAWHMGDALLHIGAFDDEYPMVVRMRSIGPRYWLYIPVEREVLVDEEIMETFQWMEDYLTEVMEKPTRLVLLVASVAEWEEIPVRGWDGHPEARRDAWDIPYDTVQANELWKDPEAMAMSEPALESATANPDLTEWVAEWTDVCGALYSWSFEFTDVQERSLDPDAGRHITWLAEGDELDAVRATLEWSPSEEFALNMFVHNLGRSGRAWSPHREEPDRWVYFFRTNEGNGWPILVVGPSTPLHAIGWTDDRTAVVLGIAPEDSVDCLHIWRVRIGDLAIRVERHQGPPVTAAQREGLARRWPSWVRSHYSEVEWAQ